jgi:hypothetical protein
MTWTESVEKERMQARRELEAAEEGLRDGTPAAHTRYVRALHEAELAEQRAEQASRDPRWRTWH